jgi:hypothetical protein
MIPMAAAAHMAIRTGLRDSTQPAIGGGGAFKMTTSPTLWVQDRLEHIHDESVIVDWHGDEYDDGYVNAWLTYFARRNRVYLVNPHLNDGDASRWVEKLPTSTPSRGGLYLLKSSKLGPVEGRSASVQWLLPPYSLWSLQGSEWAYVSRISGPVGRLDDSALESAFAIEDGMPATIVVNSGCASELTLEVLGRRSNDPQSGVALEATTDDGATTLFSGGEGRPQQTATVRVHVGENRIRLSLAGSGPIQGPSRHEFEAIQILRVKSL